MNLVNNHPSIKQLETRIAAWAQMQPDIRAIVVVGSLARRDHPADEWADLDMILFVSDLAPYLSGVEWLTDIGEVWVSVPFLRGDGLPEYLVLYEGGLKADFAFAPVDDLHQMIQARTLSETYQRGYYGVVDKDGLIAQLPAPSYAPLPDELPSAQEFQAVVEAFWYEASQIARCLRRGDLWSVKQRDRTLKDALLHMLEWHAQVLRGADTWQGGRFMAEWSDPPTWAALHETFGHFDAADSWRALWASMDLFRRLAQEAASRLHYNYPAHLDERITAWVRRMYAGD